MPTSLLIACIVATPVVGEDISFVGFSGNERLAAWKVEVTREVGHRIYDRYSLIRVLDATDGRHLGTYQGSSIKRLSAEGKRVRAAQTALAAANPDWTNAKGRSAWKKLKKVAVFSHRTLEMETSALRLAPDPDAAMEADARKKHIDVVGAAGSPVGYHAVARRFDGHLLSIGHFRRDAGFGQQVSAHVQVYFSKSGYGVAIANRFTLTEGENKNIATDYKVTRLREAPLATVRIGAINSANAQLMMGERLYKSLHPEARLAYESLVGPRW